jgi:hypothetical protein
VVLVGKLGPIAALGPVILVNDVGAGMGPGPTLAAPSGEGRLRQVWLLGTSSRRRIQRVPLVRPAPTPRTGRRGRSTLG